MALIRIYVPDDLADRLEEKARKQNMPVSGLVEIAIRDLLRPPDPEFERIIQRVMTEDRELLERLADCERRLPVDTSESEA